MSKFRYSAMSSCCSKLSESTYAVDPTRPYSSALHHANRTALFTLGRLPNWSAVSSSAADPLPSSLMPGPSVTLSRWAPAITTLSVRPVLVCATTL
jgi:hypothetical protein